ncbi:Endonuclease III-like protein [Zancudomyces culisetae]|uniref:Endonuclease III homolog n=1 Tax=Zancudomyces culisetae TaxID=1213189 RepID=A0A1R1PUS7_ZANCU|nr:Endonuclease III-like protein [Zancudomyces culisetae]|eukprot:OMH84724.1 Endonuclease III-like protein [Zancudomyces culisetae]
MLLLTDPYKIQAAASSDGQVRVYSPEEAPNMQNWRVSAQLDAADGITLKDSDGPLCISWCEERLQPATMMLVGCNRIRQVRVFRYIRNNWVHYFDVAKYRSDILCVSWAPQMGRSFHLIATGCADGIVRIYRINTSSSIDPVKFDLDSLFDQSTNSIEPPIPKVFDSNDVSVLQLTSKDATPADKTRALDVQTQEPMTIVDGTTKAAALEVNSVSGVPIGVALDEQPPDTTQNSLFKPQENIKIQLLAELNGHNRLPIRKLKWNIVGSVLVSCGDDGSTVLCTTSLSNNKSDNNYKDGDGSGDEKNIKSEPNEDLVSKKVKLEPKAGGRRQKQTTKTEGAEMNTDGWEEILEKIKNYRAKNVAPVDVVGCEAIGDKGLSAKERRFRTLVSLMLSSQTRDELTSNAVNALDNDLGGLTPENLAKADIEDIKKSIRMVGFWNRKAQYLIQASKICIEKFDSDIPDTLKGLLDLPGVGPKMAYLALQAAWNSNSGIGVDTHVFRIAHRLGWANTRSNTPELVRTDLESWLPKDEWPVINKLLVGLGQTVCTAKKPQCDVCPVGKLCPSSSLSGDEKNIKSEPNEDLVSKKVKLEPKAGGRRQKQTIKTEGAEMNTDGWEEILEKIKNYRAKNVAPVDVVGCEAIGDKGLSAKERRFRTLVSLMLSSQTRDELTSNAVNALDNDLGGLTPENLAKADIEDIKKSIRMVGFWNRKAQYLIQASKICIEKFDSDIPDTLKGLLDLPGVGPKMAYLALQAAWNSNSGIGVDTHVFRIAHRLGWANTRSNTPELVRTDLESWLPKDEWPVINKLLVGLGQTVCTAKKPQCDVCPVGKLCPSSSLSF